eukprot:scaffold1.g5732.t1
MGRSHGKASTYARLAEPLGFVPAADIFHAVKAVVAVQRDYGRRDDRKQSRLKYLVSEWGIDRFRAVTEQIQGLEAFLEPIFAAFKAGRASPQESFGDFVTRLGFDALREAAAAHAPPAPEAAAV